MLAFASSTVLFGLDTLKIDSKLEIANQSYKEKSFEEASIFFQETIDQSYSISDTKRWSKGLEGKAKCLRKLGDYKASASILFKAINQLESFKDPAISENKRTEIEGRLYTYLGISKEKQGFFDAALKAYLAGLSKFESINLANNFVASVYKNVGNIYNRRMDMLNAIAYIQKSLKILETINSNSDRLAASYNDLGLAFLYSNKNTEAKQAFKKGLGLINLSIQKASILHSNLTLISLDELDLPQAKKHLKKLLELSKKMENYESNFSIHSFAGNIALLESDTIKAKKEFELAAHKAKQSLPSFHRDLARQYLQLAKIEFEICKSNKQNCSNGISAIQEAFQALASIQNQPKTDSSSSDFLLRLPQKTDLGREPMMIDLLLTYASYLNKQITSSNTKLINHSLDCLDLAIFQVKKLRLSYSNEQTKLELGTLTESIVETALEILWKAYNINQNSDLLERIFLWLDLNKSQVLLEAIHIKNTSIDSSSYSPDSLLARQADFKLMQFEIKALLEESSLNGKAYRETLGDSLFRLERQIGEISQEIDKVFPHYEHLLLNRKEWGLKEFRKLAMVETDLLLQYELTQKYVYIFGLSKKKGFFQRFELEKNFSKNLDRFLGSIREPNAQYKASSFFLFQSLVKPALDFFGKSQSRLLIIPESKLSLIPFEALVVNAESPEESRNRFLIEDYSLSYSYSTSLLLESLEASEKDNYENGGIVAFAPIFEGGVQVGRVSRACGENQLATLAYSIDEVEGIAKQTNAKIFLNEEAKKQEFIDWGIKANILHLATHACTNDEDPLLSRIYFSDAEFISTYELYQSELNASLAVLSACNTGGGALVEGEGVMSLSRGFASAGVPNLIMSLWSVDDAATSQIMISLYKNLVLDQTMESALRNAKLEFLENANTSALHPFNWAAFVLYGPGGKPEFSTKSFNWTIVKISLLSLVAVVLLFFLIKVLRSLRNKK